VPWLTRACLRDGVPIGRSAALYWPRDSMNVVTTSPSSPRPVPNNSAQSRSDLNERWRRAAAEIAAFLALCKVPASETAPIPERFRLLW
jgi:hypothetical protein